MRGHLRLPTLDTQACRNGTICCPNSRCLFWRLSHQGSSTCLRRDIYRAYKTSHSKSRRFALQSRRNILRHCGRNPKGNQSLLIRPDKDSIDFRFLRHWLNSPLMASYIHGFRDGSVAERLNLPTIRSLPVLVPPAFEQKAIADVLGALDDKIAINERIVVTGEDLAITVASSKRWASIIPLGEIVRHVRDQVSPETFAIDRVAHYSLPAFDAGQMPELVSPTAIKSSKFLVNGPSVLLSKLNPSIPRVWSVDPSPDVPALASTEFLVLKPIDGISAHEIWAVSSQPDFINELTAKVTGTSNSHQRVKPTDLLNTRIVDPRAISDGIRGLISSIADRARRARRESLALTELRDTLLPRLMSGEIRVRDAEKVVKEVT